MVSYLVTGGAGFIGSHIVEELLKRGHRVRVPGNFLTGKRENLALFTERIERVGGYFRDPDVYGRSVKGIYYVLQQAALPSYPRSVADPITMNDIFVRGPLASCAARIDCQWSVWHSHHKFRFLIHADEVKAKDDKEFLGLLNRKPLFHPRQAELETLTPADGPKVRKWTTAIRNGFAEPLKASPETRYLKTWTYFLNFAQQALAFIDYWLANQQWIPLKMDIVESEFNRVASQIKRAGRCWSDAGLLRWMKIAFLKIFHPAIRMSTWCE